MRPRSFPATTARAAPCRENVHNADGRADLIASLDDLQALAPNLEAVSLVVGWFGDDLRCGNCLIKPGVETRGQGHLSARPGASTASTRGDAHVVSQMDGRPAYGGTPSDDSVVQAIAESESARPARQFLSVPVHGHRGRQRAARSLSTGGASGQPAYPWRGRITCSRAGLSRIGRSDRDGGNAGQRLLRRGHGSRFLRQRHDGQLDRRRRLGLPPHGAALRASLRGGGRRRRLPDRLGIARADARAQRRHRLSGRRGAEDARGRCARHPRRRHQDRLCRRLVGIQQPPDRRCAGRGAVQSRSVVVGRQHRFRRHRQLPAARRLARRHRASRLRRGERPHLARTIAAYLQANIRGGEDYDWYYATDADRAAQTRTPITDGAYGKPWVFRAKDFWNWWANAHYDRADGTRVRARRPPGCRKSKADPVHRTGLPGGRQGRQPAQRLLRSEIERKRPALFLEWRARRSDPAPLSRGASEFLDRSRANNPTSSVYAAPMVDTDNIYVWSLGCAAVPVLSRRAPMCGAMPRTTGWAIG